MGLKPDGGMYTAIIGLGVVVIRRIHFLHEAQHEA
jgi:hypothetical protein